MFVAKQLERIRFVKLRTRVRENKLDGNDQDEGESQWIRWIYEEDLRCTIYFVYYMR